MPNVFEVGKFYEFNHGGFPPIEVLRRTDKTIWVRNEANKWAMRIRHGEDGEYCIDSNDVRACGKRYTDEFTVLSKYPLSDDDEQYFRELHRELWSKRS